VALPNWVRDDESKPAPQPLLVVQAFVNTWDAESGTDLLAGPEPAVVWLREAGLVAGPDRVTPDGLRQARQVREGLRALLEHNGGGPVPGPDALAPLGALARASQPRLEVGPDGQILLAGGPPGELASGLAGLLLIVRDAQRQGSWARLKACRNPDCRWAFYDRSHARRGAWCDMATCGNMIKNRNLRARQRT
jgi:predicted RNA-binding Zn ribbon-like protein